MNDDFINVQRTNVLGVGICAFAMNDAVRALMEARCRGVRGYVCVTSVHGVIESQRDSGLKGIHNRSFMTVPDGMPNVWMGREQGFVRMGRVYGPDLMLALCAATSHPIGAGHEALGARGAVLPHAGCPPPETQKTFTHFLYGSTPEVLKKLKANLEKRFPGIRIVGTYAPPFRPLNETEEAELHDVVSVCRPDFFWVGLSTPKQERFMASHSPAANDGSQSCDFGFKRDRFVSSDLTPKTAAINRYPLDCGIMLGVGAAFDIHAGVLKDAPGWIKNSGLQWFYRLCQEPRRLWRRYLDIVPRFIFLAALQLLGIKKYDNEA